MLATTHAKILRIECVVVHFRRSGIDRDLVLKISREIMNGAGRANISFAAATPSCMQSSFLPDPAQYQLDMDLHVITYGSDRQLEKFVGGCAKETRKAISPVAAAYVSDRHGTKSHGAGV
jgi:hypothetical protein